MTKIMMMIKYVLAQESIRSWPFIVEHFYVRIVYVVKVF